MTSQATTNSFDFGRVIKNTFGAIQQNAATFAILALLLAGIPAAISTFGLVGLFGRLMAVGSGAPAEPSLAFMGFNAALAGGGALINVFANAILQAAIMYGTAAFLNGRTASLGECFGAGLRRCLPLIGLMIVIGFAVFFGFLLLIVPAIMMAVAWIVAVPALVVERTGVFAALGRSADLTRGRRWPIFGFIVLYFIAFSVVQQVVLGIVGSVIVATTPSAVMLRQLPVSAALGVVVAVLASAGSAAIYYELRTTREGIGPEALASVFD
jgi:hypothetical protein